MTTKYNIFAIYLDESVVKAKGNIADRIENLKTVAATKKAAKQMAENILATRNGKKGCKPLKFDDAWSEFSNKEDCRFGYNPKKNSGIRQIIRAIPSNFKIKI